MSSTRLLVSLPDDLTTRFRAVVPVRQRSQVIRHLLEDEVKKREQQLYQCALSVEADVQLNKEMQDWDVTTQDGFDNDESW